MSANHTELNLTRVRSCVDLLDHFTLSSWIRTPVFSYEFPTVKPESPVRTNVNKKWINHIEHRNHQDLSLRNIRFGHGRLYYYNI